MPEQELELKTSQASFQSCFNNANSSGPYRWPHCSWSTGFRAIIPVKQVVPVHWKRPPGLLHSPFLITPGCLVTAPAILGGLWIFLAHAGGPPWQQVLSLQQFTPTVEVLHPGKGLLSTQAQELELEGSLLLLFLLFVCLFLREKLFFAWSAHLCRGAAVPQQQCWGAPPPTQLLTHSHSSSCFL